MRLKDGSLVEFDPPRCSLTEPRGINDDNDISGYDRDGAAPITAS
jgi:hypothetical protein